MRLSVATNFDPELVEKCRDYPVTELFGKLRTDAVGGGRAPYQLAKVSRRQLEDHVRHLQKSGIAFNYLLNSSCMGNREITSRGQQGSTSCSPGSVTSVSRQSLYPLLSYCNSSRPGIHM